MENGHADLRAFVLSVDQRLEALDKKLDAALARSVSKSDCQERHKSVVDQRYFIGASAILMAGLALIGAFMKFWPGN